MIRFDSLQTRLVLFAGSALCFIFALETFTAYRDSARTANTIFDQWLLDSAHSIAHEVVYQQDRLSFVATPESMNMFAWDESDSTRFSITTLDGELIAGDLPTPLSLSAQTLQAGALYADVELNGVPARLVAYLETERHAVDYVVQVAETLNKRESALSTALVSVVTRETLLLSLAIFTLLLATHRGLQPLSDVTAQLTNRSPRNFKPLVVDDAPAEIQALTDSTNQLLQRIDNMVSVHEQFIGNIAHQIRTPLAGIKLQIQLAARTQDPVVINAAMNKIEQAVDNMSHMNTQLLQLARLEIANDRGIEKQAIDVGSIMQRCCDETAARVATQGIELIVMRDDRDVEVRGDPVLLNEMLRNLLDNAINHGGEGLRVWVSLEQTPQQVLLSVEDDGLGIPTDQAASIFERFYRPLDQSDGVGLGLPIVREIARAHGGEVTLEAPVRGSGAHFLVRLPLR